MSLYLTPYRIDAAARRGDSGGLKMALTDEDCSRWVEFGGRGRQKPPNLLPKQTQFGYASLNELWSVVFDLLRDHREMMQQPLNYHNLYAVLQNSMNGEFLRGEQRAFSAVVAQLGGSAAERSQAAGVGC